MPSFKSRTTTYLLKRLVKAPAAQSSSVSSVRLAVNALTRLPRHQSGVKIQNSPHIKLPGEWVTPRNRDEDRLIFYIHGGGYFFGSPQTHRPLTTRLCKLAGAQLFALKYRLAPEHSFPAPVEDAVRAYRELLSLGYHPDRIVVAGDSAGGGLALASLAALRDKGVPLPAGLICFSPWTDLAISGASVLGNAHNCAMFQPESLHQAAQQYLAEESPFNPLASPLYADLRNLPPVLLHVSSSETLLTDSTRLAEKAKRSGVAVELEIYNDQPHVWQIFPYLKEATDSLEKAAEAIRSWVPPRSYIATA